MAQKTPSTGAKSSASTMSGAGPSTSLGLIEGPPDVGETIARFLEHVWRGSLELSSITPEHLEEITPHLIKSGAGPLGWWRIRNSAHASTDCGAQLHNAYRLSTLQVEMQLLGIRKAFALLRAAGIEPVLVKGFAIARLYPEAGLRPFSDIDLVVHPDQYTAAGTLLDGPDGRRLPVDLHNGFEGLGADSYDEYYMHSQLERAGDFELRVLAPEHQLRALCFHMLRHEAFRPLWLVDVALSVERPSRFDWELCFGTDRRRADWVACAIGLAHHLLGACIEDTPVAERATKLPSWLVSTVLECWSRPFAGEYGSNRHVEPMTKYLRDPRGLIEDLRNRWPGAIEATMSVGGPFNRLPRWPFQLANCLQRAARFVKKFPRTLAEDQSDLNRDSASQSRGLIET